ncbi:tetratricopeptide repeat protein [Ktedonosporobacter rubrisoli]|uniref:Tetratricopeptide repeat protein n=1 Tax=Ktedonosporobacter rubrisoli TaxID=2509675 RepID=A0A4V0Z015_KTERU|nr:transglutaminase-like domain-containing protein [Ktedonosporobacter rubrisoli]QBD81641.1 tetratricopeptide repeat protein [Ktedonosporobacter rubrisoli]
MTERNPKDSSQERVYRAIEALVAGEDEAIDLARAALLIASIEYPDLDMAHYMAQLDALARRVYDVLALPDPSTLPQLPADIATLDVIKTINQVLFVEEQFHGNHDDYYNSNNSLFNKVLDEHTGIPITLSLLYMEVAKRVGIRIEGIGLPFHFVVRCRLPDKIVYIDSFHQGRLLSEEECREMVRHIARTRLKVHSHWFEPVRHKQLLIRILNNLKKVYTDNEDYIHALTICDLLVLIAPQTITERRDRGVIHLQLKHYAPALHDLTAYVEQAPGAKDRYDMLNYIKAVRQIIAMMN